jgi:hypothetical protein
VVDFFEEVEEDLRSERLARLAKYAPYAAAVVGVVFAGALAFAGWRYYADTSISKASIAYDKGVTALASGDKAAATRDFTDAQKPLASGYKALALMQLAGLDGSQGRDDTAVQELDAAAKAAGGDRILGDLASLQAAYRRLDSAPFSEMETRLKPLTEAGRPFRAAAYEALAMAQLKAGKINDAKANFALLKFLPGAPQDMRERAEVAAQTLDSGDRDRVLDIAKTAATLPQPAAATAQTSSAGSPVAQAGAAPQ